MDIKRDIKPFWANLLRLDIDKYLKSKEFNLFIIDNDIDDEWHDYMKEQSQVNPSFDRQEEQALGQLLSELYSNILYPFDRITLALLIDFASWSEVALNFNELYDNLKKLHVKETRLLKFTKEWKKIRDFKLGRIESTLTSTEPEKSMNRKIFISHSSKDYKIVEQVIETLEAIGVPSNKIFCTSFEGYNIRLGDNFLETIKSELNGDVLVIFILSNNFYSSPISLCEMGATWVQTNEHIPILIPPFDYKDIQGVIPYSQGMKINEPLKLNSLKKRIEQFLPVTPIEVSPWERKRNRIIEQINTIIQQPQSKKTFQPLPKDASISVNDNDLIKEWAKEEWPNDFEMQVHYIEKQKNALKTLKTYFPQEISEQEFLQIRKSAQKEWPNDFEMQLHHETTQIENLVKLKGL